MLRDVLAKALFCLECMELYGEPCNKVTPEVYAQADRILALMEKSNMDVETLTTKKDDT